MLLYSNQRKTFMEILFSHKGLIHQIKPFNAENTEYPPKNIVIRQTKTPNKIRIGPFLYSFNCLTLDAIITT